MTSIIPLGAKIVVEPVEDQKKYGSIVVPETSATQKPRISVGRVVEVGEGERQMDGSILPNRVSKGNIVIFPTEYKMFEYKYYDDTKTYKTVIFMNEIDILAILKDFE